MCNTYLCIRIEENLTHKSITSTIYILSIHYEFCNNSASLGDAVHEANISKRRNMKQYLNMRKWKPLPERVKLSKFQTPNTLGTFMAAV